MIFLYVPLFWWGGTVANSRDFFSLSIFEMACGTFFSVMPIAILILLDKKSKQ
jgi:hypothetical protein